MRLFGCDYDGTLRIGTVAKGDLEALARFRKAGNRFAIVSGRGKGMIWKELQYFGVEVDFLIADNGAIIFDENGDEIWRLDPDQSVVRQIIDFGLTLKYTLVGFGDGHGFAGLGVKEEKIEKPNFNALLDSVEADPQELLAQGKINAILLRGVHPEDSFKLQQMVQERWGKQVTTCLNNGTLDIIAAGASKQAALEWLKEYLHASEVLTLGDGYNDIGMISAFGGYAMENAPQEVKAKAAGTVASVAEYLLKWEKNNEEKTDCGL